MNVSLVSYTHEGEKLIAVASKVSRSRKDWDYLWRTMTEEEVETWIKDALLHGYLSAFEHSVYTFSVSGISRVASHQLVRHRIASYTQTSHRFARPVEEYYRPVTPPSAEKLGDDLYKKVYSLYLEALNSGVPEEDARYFLPNGVNTNIVVTMNARELISFFSLRLCTRAQWEIRSLAWRMYDLVKGVHPRIFRYVGPSCILHENWIRETPTTVEGEEPLVSERCIEGVPRAGIRKCLRNARKLTA